MVYQKLSDLPDAVRDNLPKDGQKIYRAAFNNAWDEYSSPSDRRGAQSLEEEAHKVAWSAVKAKYVKNDNGRWVAKDEA